MQSQSQRHRTTLRLWEPGRQKINQEATLQQFFRDWYTPEATQRRDGKPLAKRTIERRGNAVDWFDRLLGPLPVGEITQDTLQIFQRKLRVATYQRVSGGKKYSLSETTQKRHLQEVLVVLATLGPPARNKLRADVLRSPPWIYVEPIKSLPKFCWSIDEARQIAKGVSVGNPQLKSWPGTVDQWRQLSRATLALWFYTGHRARTIFNLARSALVEIKPQVWALDIGSAVKTGKASRIGVHPRLLVELHAIDHGFARRGSSDLLIPWPRGYGAVKKYSLWWQRWGGLPESRMFTPQAWRRLHGEAIELAALATQAASQSLGHSSMAITTSSYVTSMASQSLPDLFD